MQAHGSFSVPQVASKTAGEDVVTHVIKALTDLQPRRKEARWPRRGESPTRGETEDRPGRAVAPSHPVP